MLKNDFARYNEDIDIDEADEEDNGWKIIHTDVFRFPKQKSLFCAVLGELCYVHYCLLYVTEKTTKNLKTKMC